MRIYKRGEVYWYELEFGARRYQKSTKSKNRRIAEQIASAFHTALVKGEVGITERKPIPNLKATMKAFLTWSAQEHPDSGTAERYRYSSLPLIAFFKDAPLDQITPERVEEYKTNRARMKNKAGHLLKPATVNREVACLRAMFGYAIKANPQLRNPISKEAGVRLLPENNLQDRVLTYTEETAYLAKCSPMLRDVAVMILESGMRPEEVYELTAMAVDVDQNYLRVLSGKTPAARRRIELTPSMKEILERRLETIPSGYLFPNDDDAARPLPGIQSAHARALRESKVPRFRPYDMRHTFATRAAESGVDLITLAAMLGHSRIQMVLRYAHPSQDHQTGAMTKVLEHKKTARAKEEAKNRAAEERRAASKLHVVPRSA